MTSSELDSLVRQIGDAFTARLSAPATTPASACGCQHREAEEAMARTAPPAGAASRVELSVCEAVGATEMIAGVRRAKTRGLPAVFVGLGHVAAAERELRGSATSAAVRIGCTQSVGMAEVDIAMAAAAVRVGAGRADVCVSSDSLRDGDWDPVFSGLRCVGEVVRRAGAAFFAALDAASLPHELLLRGAALAHLAGAEGLSLSGGTPTESGLLRRAVGDGVAIVADVGGGGVGAFTQQMSAGANRVRTANPDTILGAA